MPLQSVYIGKSWRRLPPARHIPVLCTYIRIHRGGMCTPHTYPSRHPLPPSHPPSRSFVRSSPLTPFIPTFPPTLYASASSLFLAHPRDLAPAPLHLAHPLSRFDVSLPAHRCYPTRKSTTKETERFHSELHDVRSLSFPARKRKAIPPALSLSLSLFRTVGFFSRKNDRCFIYRIPSVTGSVVNEKRQRVRVR